MNYNITEEKNSVGKLKASITKNNMISAVDLYIDHMDSGKYFRIVPERVSSLSDILVLLAIPMCPSCNQVKLKISNKWKIKKWFLKFFGRSILHCSNCGSRHTVKLHHWDSETIISVFVIASTLIVYSVYVMLTGK